MSVSASTGSPLAWRANSSVNPDAPVRVFYLASSGAGAPVTLDRYAAALANGDGRRIIDT
jgi:hypothetical protein